MTGRLGRLASSTPVHLGAAFLLMGGWAAAANAAHPMPAPLLAGAVQGALSAAITLVLKSGVEAIVSRVAGAARLWAPPLAALAVSVTVLGAIHAAAGTPEILHTIALPLTVSTSYAALYARLAARRAE